MCKTLDTICDGEQDCADGFDEENCGGSSCGGSVNFKAGEVVYLESPGYSENHLYKRGLNCRWSFNNIDLAENQGQFKL